MVTRRKIVADPWKQTPHAAELINGVPVAQWENANTGEIRMVRNGLHPEDQPNAELPAMYIGDDDELEETATDRVMTMLQSANDGGRAELKVYRVNQGIMEYCKSYQPDEFEHGNFELLREKFGAGVYELRLYATNPATNKFVVRSKSRINIADDLKPQSVVGGDMSSGMAQILATIAQGQQQMLEALVSIKQTPQKDPMDEMSKMFGMMTMMREAMGISNAPASREKSSIGEIVSAIRELRGAADELIPEKDKEPDGLMAMLPSVLEMVKNGQQQAPMMQQHAPQFSPVTLPPSIAQAQPPMEQTQQPQQQPENSDVNFLIVLKLKGYLASLVDMAKKAAPIQDGAQFVYDNIPDDLIEIMALSNWFDMLSGFDKALLPHKEWLTQVRDAALKMFDEPEGGDDVAKNT
jgi:hypothetical protein